MIIFQEKSEINAIYHRNWRWDDGRAIELGSTSCSAVSAKINGLGDEKAEKQGKYWFFTKRIEK